MALIGGPEKPLSGSVVVLWDTLAVTVQDADTVLSGGYSLAGGLYIPLHGFDVVLWDILAIFIHLTNTILGDWIPFI